MESIGILAGLDPAHPNPALTPGGTITSDQRSFAEILSIAERGPLSAASSPREIAETFVAVALVQPILAEARKSSWAAEPFAPSDSEKQFGALMDAHIARDLTRAARFPLVDRLAHDLRTRQG